LVNELLNYLDCQITLVGLSKGGMTVMRYATTIDDSRIKKVITISAPIKGTHLASLLPSDTITHQNLKYESKVAQDISKAKLEIPVYHIVPKYDHMIIPVDASKCDYTDDSHIYYYDGYYSHNGITYSKDVAKAIEQWL
jgi:hypothetical protein